MLADPAHRSIAGSCLAMSRGWTAAVRPSVPPHSHSHGTGAGGAALTTASPSAGFCPGGEAGPAFGPSHTLCISRANRSVHKWVKNPGTAASSPLFPASPNEKQMSCRKTLTQSTGKWGPPPARAQHCVPPAGSCTFRGELKASVGRGEAAGRGSPAAPRHLPAPPRLRHGPAVPQKPTEQRGSEPAPHSPPAAATARCLPRSIATGPGGGLGGGGGPCGAAPLGRQPAL